MQVFGYILDNISTISLLAFSIFLNITQAELDPNFSYKSVKNALYPKLKLYDPKSISSTREFSIISVSLRYSNICLILVFFAVSFSPTKTNTPFSPFISLFLK